MFKKKLKTLKPYLPALLVCTAVLLPKLVFAGTDTTFDDMTSMLSDWTSGSLGKGLAMVALLLGVGLAAVKQSFVALFGGIGVALGATVGPTVVDGIVTAII